MLLQVLQKRDMYVQHMLDAINYTVDNLRQLYRQPHTSFDTHPFQVLQSYEAVLQPELANSCPLVLENVPGA